METIDMETIDNDDAYIGIIQRIETYLQKATTQGGFSTLTPQENQELKQLSVQAAEYEKRIKLVPVNQPLTLSDMIRLKMFQLQLTQHQTALLLEVPDSRISELVNGKSKNIPIRLAKRLYMKLGISAEFILQNVAD